MGDHALTVFELPEDGRQRASELLVQRGDDEWQRRLGDAGARVRELLQERAKALAVGELADERVENWPVHDE